MDINVSAWVQAVQPNSTPIPHLYRPDTNPDSFTHDIIYVITYLIETILNVNYYNSTRLFVETFLGWPMKQIKGEFGVGLSIRTFRTFENIVRFNIDTTIAV